MTKLTVAFRNSANAPKTCYQPQEHQQSGVTFSELGMIVINPGNMGQPTNPGAFGSHFNYLENQPMCADSALDFDVHVTVHRDKFLIIKPTRCTNFSDLFLE